MIIAANWKMNMSYKKALSFLSDFKGLLNPDDKKDFLFFPPSSLSLLFQKESFYWGGQNIYYHKQGAFTGENSAQVLKEMGASFCLVGHSERRYIFGESDVEIEKKFSVLQEQALIPVLCIGETLNQRFDKNKVLNRQIAWIKQYIKYEKLPFYPEQLPALFKDLPLIVAYEPVWSIGTGEIPSVEELQETIALIKESIPLVKVFYGGSVNADSVNTFSQCNLDGFLVGGASVDPQSLYQIYKQVS